LDRQVHAAVRGPATGTGMGQNEQLHPGCTTQRHFRHPRFDHLPSSETVRPNDQPQLPRKTAARHALIIDSAQVPWHEARPPWSVGPAVPSQPRAASNDRTGEGEPRAVVDSIDQLPQSRAVLSLMRDPTADVMPSPGLFSSWSGAS
jgi:hypothetical protein